MEMWLAFGIILLYFAIGVLLKFVKWTPERLASWLLSFVFYVAGPALIITALPSIDLRTAYLFLPLLVIPMILASYLAMWQAKRFMHMTPKQEGVSYIGVLILNIGFLIPFVLAFYGEEGYAFLMLLGVMNAIIVYTLAYALAVRYGSNSRTISWNKIVLAPPIWAVFIGLGMNYLEISLAPVLVEILSGIGALLSPAIMIALGLRISISKKFIVLSLPAIISRMVVGLFVGLLLVWITDFPSLVNAIILLASSAPIGYNTLTFASIEDLGETHAATLVGVSILIGFLLVPIIYLLL